MLAPTMLIKRTVLFVGADPVSARRFWNYVFRAGRIPPLQNALVEDCRGGCPHPPETLRPFRRGRVSRPAKANINGRTQFAPTIFSQRKRRGGSCIRPIPVRFVATGAYRMPPYRMLNQRILCRKFAKMCANPLTFFLKDGMLIFGMTILILILVIMTRRTGYYKNKEIIYYGYDYGILPQVCGSPGI